MKATKFNNGTIFNYCGETYMVIKKTPLAMDARFNAVWVAKMPKTAKDAEKWDGAPDGWFAQQELEDWRKRGIISNIINPAN